MGEDETEDGRPDLAKKDGELTLFWFAARFRFHSSRILSPAVIEAVSITRGGAVTNEQATSGDGDRWHNVSSWIDEGIDRRDEGERLLWT